MNTQNELKRSMKSRHLFMISLGGVIGTGFFLGTGYTINQAGPTGAVLSYLVGGLIMYLTMLCLGELSVAYPVSGSFQTYASKFISPATGFAVGWLYWLGWAVTVALEFLSAAALMLRWFPDSPTWLWVAIFAIILFLLNALSAKAFAETEFWFASIKVLAIIMFIILGGAAMFGLIDFKNEQAAPLFSNFVTDNGIFPNGFVALILTMIAVNFSFQGTELIGIAAGESENPEKTIPKAINNTVVRTIIFFGLGITVLAALIPYEKAGVMESPFVYVFDQIGIPFAADIMNFIIITALLSVGNSGLYAATRMLFAMSSQGMAPKALGAVNKRGVPFNALIITMVIACLALLSSVVAADTVYLWLLSVAGLGAQVGWIAITASHVMFRRKYLAQGGRLEDLKFKAPLYPFLPILATVLNVAVLVSLAFDPAQRIALYCGVPFFLICFFIYKFKLAKGNKYDQAL